MLTVTPGNDTNYGCLNCHAQVAGPPIQFLVTRDCTLCHTGDSPHHGTTIPEIVAGDCVYCHGNVVDNFDDGHAIPTYAPSLVTPNPIAEVCEGTLRACATDSACTGYDVCEDKRIACSVDDDCDVAVCANSKADCSVNGNDDCEPGHCSGNGAVECYYDPDCVAAGAGTSCRSEELCLDALDDVCGTGNATCAASPTPLAGGCNYCHDAGTDTGSGLEIADNYGTHHGASVQTILPGETSRCYTCHTHDGGYTANDMRTCERCHGYESLHNIQVDTNGGGVVPGAEDAGYGHIGTAAGPDGDCWGCHGFSVAADGVVLGSGVPSIYSADPIIIAAGTDTAIAINGTAFLNGALAVRLTDAAAMQLT